MTVEGSYDATLAALLDGLPGERVGFEAAHLTVARHRWLIGRSWMATGREPRSRPRASSSARACARTRKRSRRFARAARRLSAVAAGVLDGSPCRTDRAGGGSAIDRRIRRAGFSTPAFDTIVAGGPNAALPHAHPGERKLTEGDLVVLDFGGVYDSYCVDLTRTVSIGPATGRAPRGVRRGPRSARSGDGGRQARRVALCGRRGRPRLARRVTDGRGVRARHGPRPGHRSARGSADRAAAPRRRRAMTMKRSRPAWCSRSNRAPICRAGAACASKTTCW